MTKTQTMTLTRTAIPCWAQLSLHRREEHHSQDTDGPQLDRQGYWHETWEDKQNTGQENKPEDRWIGGSVFIIVICPYLCHAFLSRKLEVQSSLYFCLQNFNDIWSSILFPFKIAWYSFVSQTIGGMGRCRCVTDTNIVSISTDK